MKTVIMWVLILVWTTFLLVLSCDILSNAYRIDIQDKPINHRQRTTCQTIK